jgi:hypothetical protein
MFAFFMLSSVNPFSRIHALPKTAGEYQMPPITKVETAAARIAQ